MSEQQTGPVSSHMGLNAPVVSVSEISGHLKRLVEDAFAFVRVRGEISGFKRAASGHLYFRLKDDRAVLDAVCWRGAAARLSARPEDGLEVIVTGRLTTYPGRSNYQIVVEAVEVAGEGALLKLLEDRRKALAAEGLFDAQAKRKIPFLPRLIGVVTSPTGAVIRDILHRLNDRFPTHVLLWPSPVQGDEAAERIAGAIEGFNRLKPGGAIARPDVLIVARGGGSLEDLWAFNEENVVRAVAQSTIPVISAVGHESDTTLIDFVADLRAPTPSAAAEMAVPVRSELLARLQETIARLTRGATRMISTHKADLSGLGRGLPDLASLVAQRRQRLDDWAERLDGSLAGGVHRRHRRLAEIAGRLASPRQHLNFAVRRLEDRSHDLAHGATRLISARRQKLEQSARLLESLSYRRILDRGFVLVTDIRGRAVDSVQALRPGDDMNVRFKDGSVRARVIGGAPAKPGAVKKKKTDRQGSLL